MEERQLQLIDSILHATNHYEVLGISPPSSFSSSSSSSPPSSSSSSTSSFSNIDDEIRRQYVKRSRLVHPDKCNLPNSTAAFQKLSTSYRILSDTNLRRQYDLYGSSPEFDADDETFTRLANQLFDDFLKGDFTYIMQLVDVVAATNPQLSIDKNLIEEMLRDARHSYEESNIHSYIAAIQFDIMRLYEIQQEIRIKGYSNIMATTYLSLQFLQTLLSILIVIQEKYNTNSERKSFIISTATRITKLVQSTLSVIEASLCHMQGWFEWLRSWKSTSTSTSMDPNNNSLINIIEGTSST